MTAYINYVKCVIIFYKIGEEEVYNIYKVRVMTKCRLKKML